MRSFSIQPARPYRVMIVACVTVIMAVFGSIVATQAQAKSEEKASAEGGRLISIHENGVTRGILTNAATLREAFSQAGIAVSQHDLVEPGLDQELVASQYDVNVYRARPVTIVDGTVRMRVMTPYQTTEQIAKQANVTLQDEDDTQLRTSVSLKSQSAELQMTIDRAVPVTLMLYGKKVQAYTQGATVSDMLREKNITLGENDMLSLAETTPITKDMTIELWREGKQVITEEEDVDFAVEQIHDTAQPIGFKEVKTPGEKGKRTVSYEIVMKNGKEISRKEIRSVSIKEPKKQIETVGAKPSFGGDFGAALAKLRACESGGNYANKNNPLYRGAYQFGYGTWGNKYGIYDPADASPAQQDQAARELYERRGWQPWPHCGANLPDTYR